MIKRGIALTPVKFGISFTATHYNQAGALLHLYNDGTLLLNHGGTEMGQGLLHQGRAGRGAGARRAARPRCASRRRDTSKVPNASPTAASSGSDLNGMAARDAARTLRERLAAFAARKFDCEPAGRRVRATAWSARRARRIAVRGARAARVLRARAAVRDRLLRDAEDPLRPQDADRPAVLLLRLWRGRVRGRDRHADRRASAARGRHPARRRALAQSGASTAARSKAASSRAGAGSRWRSCGGTTRASLRTHAPSTYKIPTAHDVPAHFHVDFFGEPNREETIHRSQGRRRAAVHAGAVGIPRAARRDRERRRLPAAAAARCARDPERILRAVEALRDPAPSSDRDIDRR